MTDRDRDAAPTSRTCSTTSGACRCSSRSQREAEQRTILLDFGYTAEALVNNIGLMRVDPAKIQAMIISHGHYDHFGGLQGFLDKYRSVLPAELKLYAGGEDNFCQRLSRTPTAGQFTDFGILDRRELAAKKVTVVLCETPTLIADHAFTTGKIKRSGVERILPNSFVKFEMKDGLGCNASHYTPAELAGKIVPDEHIHEHATCFNLEARAWSSSAPAAMSGSSTRCGRRRRYRASRRCTPSSADSIWARRRPTTSSRSSPRSRSSIRTW